MHLHYMYVVPISSIIRFPVLCSLQPSGGSGMYVWSSSNTSVSTVSTKGIVMTTNAVGHTQVRAADMKNQANFGTAEVGPSCPEDLVKSYFKSLFIEVIKL